MLYPVQFVVASRYGNYTKGQDTGVQKRYKVDGQSNTQSVSHIENNIYGENQVVPWTESKHKLEKDP